MSAPTARAAVSSVLALFAEHGSGAYVGEAVSQEEHGTQAAAHAAACGSPPHVICAALLHDVGHMLALRDPTLPRMGALGAVRHEALGAAWLASLGFPPALTTLVARHVDAKRYLCARDPAYAAKLSEASRGTLAWQGGPMNEAQVREFEDSGLLDVVLRMRTWDEAAKTPGRRVRPLAEYAEMLEALVEGAR